MTSLKDNCSQLILNEPFLVQKEGDSINFKQFKNQDNETVYYLPYDPSTSSSSTSSTNETEVKENMKPFKYNKQNKRRKRYTTNCPYKKPSTLLKLQNTTRTLKLLKKYRAQQTLESCTTQWRSVAEEASDKLLKYIKEMMSHSNAAEGGGWTVKKMFQSMRLDVTLLELSSEEEEEEQEEEEEEPESEEEEE
jgi:hypothetical protein